MTHNTQTLLILALFGLQFITLTLLVVAYGRMKLYLETAKDYKDLLDEAESLWGSSLASRKEELARQKQLLTVEKNT